MQDRVVPHFFPRTFLLCATAIIVAGISLLTFFHPFRATEKESPSGQETHYSIGIEQPIPGGTVTLDNMYLENNKPEMLRIAGHFTGPNPRDRYFIESRVRESSNGFENGDHCWYVPLSGDGKSDVSPFCLEYMNFPLAADRLHVRIYFRDKSASKVAWTSDFDVPNRLKRIPRKLIAEPLPIARKAGSLEVRLTGLETASATTHRSRGFREGLSRASFTIFENGSPSDHWSPMDMHLSTGTGQTFRAGRSWPSASPDGRTEELIDGTLWKCEGPWKILLTLMRTNDFHPDELLEIKDLAVPAEHEFSKQPQEWKVGNMTVRFLGITGGGVKVPGWGDEKPDEISLYFETDSPDKDACIKFLAISDQDGKVLPSVRTGYRRSYPNGHPFMILLPPYNHPRPLKINCKLAVVSEKQVVEFTANPTFLAETFDPK